jgi:hypothetical protein
MTSKIEKYIDLLRKGTSSIDYKKTILPFSLYKYRPLSENTLNCLEKDSIWISSAESQNDPFESALFYSDKEYALAIYKSSKFKDDFNNFYGKTISDKEIEEITNDSEPEKKFREICKKKNIIREYNDQNEFRKENANKIIKKIKEIIMLSSFSERNDSILMWSHYSEKHQGICIEYDFSNSLNLLNFLEPIYYSDKFNSLSNALHDNKFETEIRIAAITKANDWQYEKEWRFVFPNKKSGYLKVPLPKAIYLGARFDDNKNGKSELIERLTLKCQKNNIPIFNMKIHDSEYKIIKI